jgi:lipopolysaccharide transport system permease protein
MSLREYLRIVVELIRRDLRTRYAGSLMGVLWSIGVPALNALVLSAVFSVLMRGRMGVHYEGLPFAVFYFAGFAPWVLFTEATGRAAGIIVENAAIVKRLRFPLEALCVQVVGSAIIGHVVVLVVAGLLMLVYGVAPTWHLLALPLLLVVTLTLTLGICFALSALSVFLRDLTMLVPVGLNLMFFLTPILYPPVMLETAPRLAQLIVLDLNPWHHIVEGYRWAVLGTPTLDMAGLAYAAVLAIAALAGGLALFRRLKGAFADVL